MHDPDRAEPVAIEHNRFLASVRSPEARSLVAAARRLQRSSQFPPADPDEL